jgi:Tol biopolymer transport system component
MVGQTISHYHVLRQLGAGGMGVVYAAEDLRLHRQVAIKILSPRLADAPHALARFEREALAASACNHPNICTIHDVDRQDGIPFIVMELVDGVSLREYLATAPVPIGVLLHLSIQVADALQTAHAAGIVHRDLTPSNVFVTRRGDAKVLDFGIAKLVADQQSEVETEAATTPADAPLTGKGHILGTPGYASPEQTLGLAVDARTDLFSLGVILYQMATGRRPFDRTTPGLVSDAVVHVAPVPPVRLNPQVPLGLAAIIEKALEKDPAVRYQSAADLKADLRRLKRHLESGGVVRPAPIAGGDTPITPAPVPAAGDSMPPPMAGTARSRQWWGAATTVIAVALAGALVAWLWLRADAVPQSISRTVTSGSGADTEPALSPDGTRIAYIVENGDDQDLWMVDAQGVSATPWKTGAGRLRHPAWSPDGRRLYFESQVNGEPTIFQAESLNGQSTTPLIANGGEPAISPDGKLIAFVRRNGASNEQRVAVAPLDDVRNARFVSREGQGLWDHDGPTWSPDGRELCYAAWDGLWVVPVGGGGARQLTQSDSTDLQPAWSSSGYIYFSSKRDGLWHLWRVPADGGTPSRVTIGLGIERAPTITPDGRALAYSTARENYDIFIRDLETNEQRPVGGDDEKTLPVFSGDGTALVFVMTAGNRQGLWRQAFVKGSLSGVPQALLPAPGAGEAGSKASQPACSPDDSRLAFLRIQQVPPARASSGSLASRLRTLMGGEPAPERVSQRSIWTVSSQGGIPVRVSAANQGDEYQPSWAPDGRRLAFVRKTPLHGARIWLQGVENGEARGVAVRLTNGSANESGPAWSPDGRQVAFVTADTDVAIAAAGGTPSAASILAAGAGGRLVRWRSPGMILVAGYWGGSTISVRAIDPQNGRPVPAFRPVDIGREEIASFFDLSPDGRYMAWTQGRNRSGRIGVFATVSGRF